MGLLPALLAHLVHLHPNCMTIVIRLLCTGCTSAAHC